MTEPISDQPLQDALTHLLAQIAALSNDAAGPPAEMERLAKSVSAHLKSISDIQSHNERVAAHRFESQYTRYEDIPPPSPADRARFVARLQKLYAEVLSDADIEDILSPYDDGRPPSAS
ncbi:hypothetical protein ACJ3XI_02925 [Litorimonas sp. RW-G-Af-16]|uniref:hypothetical protein n=1 Tax=Litorimonas sp. RW-G-Af-16 TaxID=3241168 RepID=UPI00390CC2EC